MSGWNELDFFIFLIFVMNLIQGIVRWVTKEVAAMMCLCFALIITIKFSVPLATFLNSSPIILNAVHTHALQRFFVSVTGQALTLQMLNQLSYCLAVLLCFVGAYSLTAAGINTSRFMEVLPFPFATMGRKIGIALGCTRGYIIALLFLVCAAHIYNGNNLPGKNWLEKSFFARLFSAQTKKLDELIIAQNPDNYRIVFYGKDKYGPKQIMHQLNGGLPSKQQATYRFVKQVA